MTQQNTSGSGRVVFASRFTFVAAAIGMAVGTGNIWRFPRDVHAWGGGAFLLAVVVANLVWAIPLLMAESFMGSKSRLGTAGAFRDIMGRRFTWMGGFMGMATIAIMFYYSVVCGWAIRYLVYAVTGEFSAGITVGETTSIWEGFTDSPAQTVLFHAIAITLVGLIVFRGLKGGFEAVLKIVVPALFVILAVLAVRAMTLPGSAEGLRYLFVPDWSLLGDAELWLQAFAQMAFSTGAGWGLYLTYCVYMRRREDFALNATTIVAGNHLASLLAGIAVVCTIFALGGASFADEATGAGNEGLTFVYLAVLFGEMPGGTWFFAPLFFLVLALAGISSLIAMVELAARNVVDMGVRRKVAVPAIAAVAFLAGLPAAFNLDYLSNQDNVWGIALLISGLFAAVAMMKYGLEQARRDMDADSDFGVGGWWTILIRLFPVMFAFLFGWFIYQSVSDPGKAWWDPTDTFSLATMVVQWGALVAILLVVNNRLANRINPGPISTVPAEPGRHD
ncbi:sodium-dependent transporter [Phytoactinopolyspora alkaliphila]|uniref:Sodium-dependent transporter n=1 Tax=Phytoactinopolyspora alkaliphila TaxID=1783498 RepID=A0A6N9YRK8_9ACTN|nr:sodium-dependent transporter [Phytoactinopolyspora alkaliphila]NED97575.1 sodium-dependent transporter [Phytoactinopolyspora alkaliphila]